MRDFFQNKGRKVDFEAFDGAHTIPETGILKLHKLIMEVCKK